MIWLYESNNGEWGGAGISFWGVWGNFCVKMEEFFWNFASFELIILGLSKSSADMVCYRSPLPVQKLSSDRFFRIFDWSVRKTFKMSLNENKCIWLSLSCIEKILDFIQLLSLPLKKIIKIRS